MSELTPILQTPAVSLHEISPSSSVRRFVVSTPESREICNDPFCVGIRYTSLLREACKKLLIAASEQEILEAKETEACVLHVLRGGLNFGLREALADAYQWNTHACAYISAQRARKSENPEDWYITEGEYRKLTLPRTSTIIFGDVVATGTSLRYALKQLMDCISESDGHVRSLVFVTIGGIRSEEHLAEIDAICREKFLEYQGAHVFYLEGRFLVAESDTPVRVKLTGTDLLRRDSLLAPEFIESQYESPAFPVERCTIYDAGSRAFWLPEYYEDLREYWQQVMELAESGVSYAELLAERFPELDAGRFSKTSLEDLAQAQLSKIPK